MSYDQPKAFRPIILLNTLGKLIEKVIAERIQFTVASNDFIHPSQLGGLKFKSTTDASIILTHIIWSGWAKEKLTSSLAFDILQFFLLLNHRLLTLILEKTGLDPNITSFFANYLVRRRTCYVWNNLTFPSFEVNIGVGQGSALSPILSSLYLTLFLYILEKHLKNLKIPISILSFVDDGLIITQNKSFDSSIAQLFCSYNVLSKLLDSFGLVIEHSKTEVFHFSRSQSPFNPSPLDLSLIGGLILRPKDTWKYLGFIFDHKLTFYKHVNYYSNKAISTVKCMKLLGNSSRGINPLQKQLLYRCCILPIALYRFQLWFYNKAPLLYHMKVLDKMQRRATIWILGAFKTSPTEGIEAIAGIIPIRFYFQKIARRLQIRPFKLPTNHILQILMDESPTLSSKSNLHTIGSLTFHQKNIAKGHLIDSSNKTYGIFPSFSPLNPEFFPDSRILDNFPNCFSFNLVNWKEKEKDKIRAQELDNIVLRISPLHQTALVVTDASIKNNIATSILHVHIVNQPLTKTVHHVVFVTSMEVELFTIRCNINQACSKDNISKIVVVTDSIHTAKIIFDSKPHPYQSHTAAILSKLQGFFNANCDNSIKFWECPSHLKWRFYHDVDKDSKSFHPTPTLSRSLIVDFIFYFLFSLYFIFIFLVFSIFRTTRVRGYQSCCYISHKLMA